MGYVNEYISDENKSKYGVFPGRIFHTTTESWTFDKDKESFLLRRSGPHPEGTPGVTQWAFHWSGHLLKVDLKKIENGADSTGTHGWEKTRVQSIQGLPPDADRSALVADLRDALTAHKGLGVLSTYTTYEVFLEDREGN